MDNGAKVEIEKTSQRHNENFTTFAESSEKRICPTNEHKNGGSQIDGDSKIDDEVQHSGYSPFVFCIYNTIFNC